RIEDVLRIERLLDQRERLDRILVPDLVEQRSANAAVAVLAGQRSTEPGSERDDFIQQLENTLAPVRLIHIDQRVHVNMGVTSVPENHTGDLPVGERLLYAFDVLRKLGQRHRTVFDELHRGRMLERVEDRTGGVTKLP